MVTFMRTAKHYRRKDVKALKCSMAVKTRVRRMILKHTYQFRKANSQNLQQKTINAHPNICYLELRSKRLKKLIQCSKMRRSNEMETHVSTTSTPSNLPVVSKNGPISRSNSFLARRPQASLNVCMNDRKASSELTSSTQMHTQEQRKHLLGYWDLSCLMEVSLADNDTQVEQNHASLTESQMIHRLRQREATVSNCNPSHVSTHDQDTTQVSRPSGTGPDERPADDQNASSCVCETLACVPSRDDIELFLAEAEQSGQMMLTKRYNFDFQNHVPLQGRYEWINLTHS
ncbi:hypothetical protein O6H91_17G072400 [Diphasiastrum complanatum]|uniref:Uncharacterized protein n=4 Tax=Diphasiastrum complanatum TaxID=34168 RepID=A0ACC2B867_DIPCM|nr:hypothetical protein O6H91_17G071900 [Diphasiastrum complanatum]KAJ7525886.1 hypothetical protein O6H91_17G071900 [Diphasiastrum complanatum]KAJ7525891.1 hypothetical protein O6H91_17G072400 [Diphasiastrum complanatum]KAJ7525892.1 hypothetical protein O6H91_17G072400 [Diphasiastrum complanatum]